jgi:hypothetical protein
LDPVPGRDDCGETAAIRLLIGSRTVTDVIYAGARERLSIMLDSGAELANYYDSIDGLGWHRDRLAVSVRPDKLHHVVPCDAASQQDDATLQRPPTVTMRHASAPGSRFRRADGTPLARIRAVTAARRIRRCPVQRS